MPQKIIDIIPIGFLDIKISLNAIVTYLQSVDLSNVWTIEENVVGKGSQRLIIIINYLV